MRQKIKQTVSASIQLALITGVVFVFCGAIYLSASYQPAKVVLVAGQKINLEVVVTLEDMARGLSGRDSLADGSGMLFVYDNYVSPGFWMKEMKFPLDIIWLRDGAVVGWEKNLPPAVGDDISVYTPPTFVNAVLELKGGFLDRYPVKIGEQVVFNF